MKSGERSARSFASSFCMENRSSGVRRKQAPLLLVKEQIGDPTAHYASP
jgi:hypothetical protein